MSGPAFFQTLMGRRFYEVTMPSIAEALTTIAKAMTRPLPAHPAAGPKLTEDRLREVIADVTADDEKRRLAQEVIDLRMALAIDE